MIHRRSLKILLLGILVLSTGCLPRTGIPLSPGAPNDLARCFAPFPAGPWESVHMLEAVIGGGITSTLLGVTKGNPSERSLHSLLLTPEGFILFEAELKEGRVTVIKAMAPFDSPDFAMGLMQDVTLTFLHPEGMPTGWAKRPDGTMICQWERPDRPVIEASESKDREWRILLHDLNREMTREVFLRGPFVNGLASYVEFRAFKPAHYTLKMTLLQPQP